MKNKYWIAVFVVIVAACLALIFASSSPAPSYQSAAPAYAPAAPVAFNAGSVEDFQEIEDEDDLPF